MPLNLPISMCPGVHLNYSFAILQKLPVNKPLLQDQFLCQLIEYKMGTDFSCHTLGSATRTTDNTRQMAKRIQHTELMISGKSTGTHLFKEAVFWDFVFKKPHGQEGKKPVKYKELDRMSMT